MSPWRGATAVDPAKIASHTQQVTPASRTRGPPGVATPGVSSFWGSIVNRTVFLVDGFNLYHSLRDVDRGHGHSLRWLDLNALCSSLLHAVPGRCELAGVVYFSALARHMEAARPGTVARHLRYVDALQATGVETILGHFKRRRVRCPSCGRVRDRWEEKQTDVGIAVRLMKLAATGACERILVVSGDTDLVPAISEARSTWPARIGVAFPARRANAQLRAAADWTVNLDAGSYARHQFPAVVMGRDGTGIRRPGNW